MGRLVAFDAERGSEPGRNTTAVDNHLGAHFQGFGVFTASLLCLHTAHATRWSGQCAGDGNSLHQTGASIHCMLDQIVVQLHARARHSIARKRLLIRPIKGNRVSSADDGQPSVSVPRGGVQAHRDQFVDGRGSQAVTTNLVARKLCFFKDEDVNPQLC